MVQKRNMEKIFLWADLFILVGNVALESMGFKTFGFGGGRDRLGNLRKISTGVPKRMAC